MSNNNKKIRPQLGNHIKYIVFRVSYKTKETAGDTSK